MLCAMVWDFCGLLFEDSESETVLQVMMMLSFSILSYF